MFFTWVTPNTDTLPLASQDFRRPAFSNKTQDALCINGLEDILWLSVTIRIIFWFSLSLEPPQLHKHGLLNSSETLKINTHTIFVLLLSGVSGEYWPQQTFLSVSIFSWRTSSVTAPPTFPDDSSMMNCILVCTNLVPQRFRSRCRRCRSPLSFEWLF